MGTPAESRDTTSTTDQAVPGPAPQSPRTNASSSPIASHHRFPPGSPLSLNNGDNPSSFRYQKRHTIASFSPRQGAGGGSLLSLHGKGGASSHTSPLLAPQSPPLALRNKLGIALSPDRPPAGHESQRLAIEAAFQAERMRTKEKEANEVDLDADRLRIILKQERQRMTKQAGDIARLKQAAVQCQVEAEINEEGRINGLMRQLDNVQLEKGKVVVELEKEEQLLTTTLKKLEEVRREKGQLEHLIEREISHHSHLEATFRDGKSISTRSGGPDYGAAKAAQTSALKISGMKSLGEGLDQEEDESESDEKVDLPDLAQLGRHDD